MSDFDLNELYIDSKEISSANILGVKAGTNAPCGGDFGHGARTHFSLQNEGGTAWEVEIRDGDKSIRIDDPKSIVIRLGGDCEAHTFLEALEFAAATIRQQIDANDKQNQRDLINEMAREQTRLKAEVERLSAQTSKK